MPDNLPPIDEAESYLYSTLIAINISMLVWSLYIVIKMFYGKYKINKLTFKPLKWVVFGITFKFSGLSTYLLFSRRFAYFFQNCPEKVVATYAGKSMTVF